MTSQKSMAVYCGHQMGNNPSFAANAEKLGQLMAENGIRLVYGSGNTGLMGVVATSVIKNKGSVTGVSTPKVAEKQEPILVSVDLEMKNNLLERKARMIELSDAFCILPGGIGTLNELTDILTMHQIKEMDLPVFFLNTDGYWDIFGKMIEQMIKDGFIESFDDFDIQVFSTPEEIIQAYKKRFK